MSDEQTVVKTDEGANVASEENNAQGNDVDALLSEYANSGESKETPADEKPKAKTEESRDQITNDEVLREIKYLREDRQRAAIEAANKDLGETVKALKGDLPISEKMVKAYLEQEAKDRPGLAQAYLDRKNSPEKWAKIERQLKTQLKDEISNMPSKSATDIANQVESAVRNAKPQTPNPAAKINPSMSDREFEAAKKQRFAQAKAEGR